MKDLEHLLDLIMLHQNKLRIFKEAYERKKEQIKENLKNFSREEMERQINTFLIMEDAYNNKILEVKSLINQDLTNYLLKLGKTEVKLKSGKKIVLEKSLVAKII